MKKTQHYKTNRCRPPVCTGNLYGILLLLLFSSIHQLNYAQTISANFFSQNAWMPDSIGEGASKVFLNGKLHSNWNNVKLSKAKLVRYGGIAGDFNQPSAYQYLRMVDSIRAKGMEPILQLSKGDNSYDTLQVLQRFRYINIDMNRKVKYWSIGNEPDNEYTNNTAAAISAYIKRYALAMKKIDSSIRIIAPDFAYLATYTNSVADSLTTPGGPCSIVDLIPSGNGIASGKGYIDYFAYLKSARE